MITIGTVSIDRQLKIGNVSTDENERKVMVLY
jgi:hypothetical protein